MYKTIAEFDADLTEQSGATLKTLKALTDASLAQAVTPEGRTLGRIAWHIVGSLVEMPAHAGLPIDGALATSPVPATAAEVVAGYEEALRLCRQALTEGWSAADLSGEIPIYGQSWSRSRLLWVVLMHEAHHRGQMTVLMRQAGLAVPGVAGPSREEWAAYGMPVQP